MMFFNDLIKRRLATLLRPWLRENPELEFKLGLFRSNATLNNFTLKTSALNELLDDPSRICFKEVTVEHLSLQIAPCSSAAFTLRVHGLHITLSLGEEEDEEGVRWTHRPRDTTTEEKNKVIASIDPEGCTLHEAMERISGITRRTWRTSLFNTMLSSIHLQLHDVHVVLQCPGSNGSISCSLYAKELGAGSEFVMSKSFHRRFMSSLLVPSEESPLSVNIDGFEIRVNSGDRTSCVVASTNVHALINLKHLQFVSLSFCVPSLKLFFAPADISVMLDFYAFFSKESKRARSGLQLWKIASNKISSLLPTSTSSLLKATKFACLWLHYIRTYQDMLQLVGYPVDDVMKESIILMSGDKTYSRSVKFYWELISEIEQKLPAELVGVARRIVRSTVASCRSVTNCSSKDSLGNIIFLKLHQVFVIIQAIICSLFGFVAWVLSSHKGLSNHSKSSQHFGPARTDSLMQRYIDFNIGEISVSVTPENADQPTISTKVASDFGFSYKQMLKFHLSVDACFLRYTKNVTEKCLVFACGCWKVLSFSILEGSQKSYSKYLKGQGKKKVHDPQTVIWGEPAKVIYPSEAAEDNITNGSPSTSIDLLIGKLWLSWEEFCLKTEGYVFPNLRSPWMLCEVMSSLRDDRDRSYGLLKCGMVVGRLNFNLEYSSIAAMAAVLSQIQHSLGWDDESRKRNFVSHTPSAITEHPPRDGSSEHSSYCSKIEMTIMRLLPQKHVQVGVLVASPHVQLSLLEDQFYEENEEPRLIRQVTLNIHDIEIVLSPNLDSCLASSAVCSADNDTEPGYPVLKVPEEIDITGSVTEVYSCRGRILYNADLKFHGVKAYLEESSESQKQHILEISPITIALQGLRKEHHSFCSTMIALSAASHWTGTGFTTLIFMDELYILTKVISGLYYDLSRAFGMLASGDINHQVVPKQETFNADSKTEETSLARGWTSLISTHVQMAINITCELKSLGIVIHNSRKGYSMEDSSGGTGTKSSIHEMPGRGIYISGPKLFMDVSFKGRNMDFIIDLSGFRSIIFTYPAKNEESLYISEITNLLCSLNFLIEASVPHIKLCFFLRTFKRSLPHASSSTAVDEPNNGKALHLVGHSPLVMNAELLAGHPVIATIAISEIYVSSCPVKDILTRAHKPNEMNASFSVGEEFRTICCDFKGGFLLLEVQSVTIFAECCTSYYNRMLNILPTGSSPADVVLLHSEDKSVQDVSSMNLRQDQHLTQEHLEQFSLNISHLCLILASHDESGKLLELLIEVGFHLNQQVTSTVKKISVGISKFSMLSQCIHMTGQKPRDIEIHGLSSKMLLDSSPDLISEGSSVLEQNDTIHSVLMDTAHSTPSTSQNDIIHAGGPGGSVASGIEQKDVQLTFQNYILKEFRSSFAAEWAMLGDRNRPHKLWVGSGSISGFDMTISLTEIKIMIAAFESFSEVFTRENTSKVKRGYWSSDQDSEESAEELVADGTIVAIQDVDQHMYIAVEDVESSYSVVGANHYTLVGERSLFRVKYHSARWWKSQVQYFSLISLYAKDNSGESLRLNCRPRQGSVDISCSNDSGCALWAALPVRPDDYGDGVEPESFHPLVRRTFHLVNKKNDYAVAFIDGILEFVSKPGNLFKWKVFPDPSPASNSLLPSPCSGMTSGTSLQFDSNARDTKDLWANGNLSGITVTIDKVTLTILHELSDTKEKLPLLQGSITSTETVLQISITKVRVMNTSGVVLYCFDAQKSSWREFLHPLEICSFFSSKFLTPGSDVLHTVQSHFYVRIKELIVSLNELSMDIILFVIGKLNLAGPYAVRSSSVLANCCKVENQTSLTLLCQFYDNQEESISSRQSTTIFLRHLASANQRPEASLFSIKLSKRGVLSTSPIQLSLLEAQKFAWRTRIVSSQDSKSFPGPLIVVQLSRGIEDGLSISVSPLLKIHNDTDFPLELRFQRPQYKQTDSATMVLKAGDVLDDSMAAFGATDLSGGLRKALTSLSIGNFIFTFRPDIASSVTNVKNETVQWSDELKGGKPVSLSGVFDKFSYRVRKAFSVESEKFSMSTAHCTFKSEGGHLSEVHFLIQSVRKDVPVIHPDNLGSAANKNLPVALQEQKEIFLLPTVHVSNLLQTEIHVHLTDGDPIVTMDRDDPWSCATIPSGSAVNLYANPATVDFNVTLTYFGSSCKQVNSKDWVRKLQKQKSDVHHLDIELEFDRGKYFAILRLSRGQNGVLEASIFTAYTVENDTDTPLLCFSANQKPLVRYEAEMISNMPPDLGLYLPPKSIKSWFMKYQKLRLKLPEEKASEAQLDLDALSGLTEIDLEVEEKLGLKNITRLGVSLRPSLSKVVSTQIVSLSPRYVVSNESEETVIIRQCYLEDDMEGLIALNSKESVALRLRSGIGRKSETNAINILLRKHTKPEDGTLLFLQFRPAGGGLGWSGPVCVASLGRFYLKFRRSVEYFEGQSGSMSRKQNPYEFAAVNVVEGGSTIILHFQRCSTTNLPYRIENYLRHAPITYYQKGSSEPDILGAGHSVDYVWDDLTLPHKLVVQLDELNMLCEINLDKMRQWKPLYRTQQNRGLGFQPPVDKKPQNQKKTSYSKLIGTESVKLGYEVYADGVTRVLRICEFSDSHKVGAVFHTGTKMRLRIPYFAIHLLEHVKQEMDLGEPSDHAPIVTTRLDSINWDSILTDRHKYNQIRVKSLSVDEKWTGAPFASMLRRHQSENSDSKECILRVTIVLVSSNSRIRQVKYLSIVLQPLDLNLDEETLMKIVPFWRMPLSDSNTPSQQYYFDHFEIHPIKIVGSFLPGDSYSSYSSTQETLRSLLHSVIKLPAIKNMTVELNGVLVTHALITLRELTIKCAQHYSWYAMRSIYIAKGSPLLPPSFTSIFDDLASSSLDVFFDPSSRFLNLPGVTIGTLKLISKFINDKGFSGTKRYFGDLGKTVKTAGSNILFAAVTEISDSVLKGAEANGFQGMATGFRHGVLKLAMEPSVLSSAFMEGGPDRKIKLDRSPGIDELYIEGYLQAMLDAIYKQEYLRVRVIENQVILKNLPPNSALIEEITDRVKSFLESQALLKGQSSKVSHSLRHIRGESEWRIGPTVMTLCEHLFVSFAIRMLRKQARKVIAIIKWKEKLKVENDKAIVPSSSGEEQKIKIVWKWGIGKFVLSGIVAYVDGRLCRNIPNPVARRIVSGFLLSFLDKNDE